MTEEEKTDVMVMLARIDERTQLIREDVDALKHVILEGNGSPALTVQVASLSERFDTLEKSTAARWTFKGLVITGAVALLTSGGCTAVVLKLLG